jgi:hypothetical protein
MTETRPPIIYTPEDAGEALGGKSGEWMMEEARAGRIGHSKVGRDTVFLPEHLLAYLRANEVKPSSQLSSRPPSRRRAQAAESVPVLESRPPRRRKDAA